MRVRSKLVRWIRRKGPQLAASKRKEHSMANVFVEARPKGKAEGQPITDFVVEDHADHELATFKTQKEAIDWAKSTATRRT